MKCIKLFERTIVRMDHENYQNPQQTDQQAHPVTEPQTPRSAYIAALLHIFFPILGFGFFYRAENAKGHFCFRLGLLGLIVVAFGFCLNVVSANANISIFFILIGALLVVAIWIWNLFEAVKLFSGESTEDQKGRTLHQDFFFNICDINTDK